jgi:hypothetical protein
MKEIEHDRSNNQRNVLILANLGKAIMSKHPRMMYIFLVFIVIMAIFPWIIGKYQVFGFKITGWTWVIPAGLAGIISLVNIGRITFPIGLWLPWVGLLCFHWFVGRFNPDALQSFLQMLSPLAVGCAVSISRPDNSEMKSIVNWITRIGWIVWVLLLVRTPMVLAGVLPEQSLMAAEMTGILLLGSCYASFYACGSSRHIFYYLSMLAITLIALVRGPIVAMFSCLPLTLAPLQKRKRVILCAVLIIGSLILFNTDRMQQKMFFSGSGRLSDLYWGNPNLVTSGRSLIWNILWDGVERKPWFGNGWNFHRTTLRIFGLSTFLPHNDWLKLLYDMGVAGTGIYLIIIILQMLSLARIARQTTGNHRMLTYGVATAFIPFMLIMLTDNVILYVQFFGNLHFALIGIVYGALSREEERFSEKLR